MVTEAEQNEILLKQKFFLYLWLTIKELGKERCKDK